MPAPRSFRPVLDYAAWRETGATLHRRTQVVGKVRLALTPWLKPRLARAALRRRTPDDFALRFLQSTYRAAADLARWDPALDCAIGVARRPRPVG